VLSFYEPKIHVPIVWTDGFRIFVTVEIGLSDRVKL
jgi:hypothetical protein